jgi:hypothetical protein
MRQESTLAALLIGTLAVSVIGAAAADNSGVATPVVTVYPREKGTGKQRQDAAGISRCMDN